MASLVLLLGLVGVLQGIMFASRQNAVANKMVRAGAIANRVRAALMTQGPAIFNASAVTSTTCTSGNFTAGNNASYLDGLTSSNHGQRAITCSAPGNCEVKSATMTACVMDLGSFEESSTAATMISGKHNSVQGERDLFKVMLVRFNNSSGRTEGADIIVSWLDGGQWRSHTQYVGFYDTTVYKGANL